MKTTFVFCFEIWSRGRRTWRRGGKSEMSRTSGWRINQIGFCIKFNQIFKLEMSIILRENFVSPHTISVTVLRSDERVLRAASHFHLSFDTLNPLYHSSAFIFHLKCKLISFQLRTECCVKVLLEATTSFAATDTTTTIVVAIRHCCQFKLHISMIFPRYSIWWEMMIFRKLSNFTHKNKQTNKQSQIDLTELGVWAFLRPHPKTHFRLGNICHFGSFCCANMR